MDYEGVAIRRAGEHLAVMLLHRDPVATVCLGGYRELSEALDVRDALARLWALPALFIDADGRIGCDVRRFGKIFVRAPARRRNGALMRIRPRFLVRRKPGVRADRPLIAGRELIARH